MGNYVPWLPAPPYGKVLLGKYLHTSYTLSFSAAFERIIVAQRGISLKRIFDNINLTP